MVRLVIGSLAICWVLLLSGCASGPIIDYQKGYDFTRHKGFFFQPSAGRGPESLEHQRIRQFIMAELLAKGNQVLDEPADIGIRFQLVPIDRIQTVGSQYSGSVGFRRARVRVSTPTTSYIIRDHVLVVEFFDAEKQIVIWKAQSRDSLSASLSPEERESRLQEWIKEMLKGYPPLSESVKP